MADVPPFSIRFKPRATTRLIATAPMPAAYGDDDDDDDLALPEATPIELAVPPRAPGADRSSLYQDALAFAARISPVVDAAGAERVFLRDQLDRKSASLPQLIAQALASADLRARRVLYQRAREMVTDCTAILDLMAERGAVPAAQLEPARALAPRLTERLLALTVPPARAR